MNRGQHAPFLPVFGVFIGLVWTVLACGQNTSLLTVRVTDETGRLNPARAWVQVGDERLFQPDSPAEATPYARDRSFSFDGVFTMSLPAGPANLHVEKGKEYLPVDIPFEVKAGETMQKTVRLERWINMPVSGWYSADLHVHLGQDDPRILTQLALADDVHLIPAFTYWLRGQGETWHADWPDESYTRPVKIDDRHIITRNNIEIERISRESQPGGFIGATFLYNLNQPVTAELNGEHFPTDARLCRVAQLHSPQVVLDSDKPSWSETVVGVALGAMDTIQLCHNHFHRETSITGGWGMIGPLAAGESNAAAGDGLFHRTNSLYYRFLNCGFKLGVSGGSAIGVMPVPTGFHRVYAKIDGAFTADKYWQAIKAGRSFTTTGPMLFLNADGKGVGETISLSAPDSKSLRVAATVRSIENLESLEIVHDGKVVAWTSLKGKDPTPVLEERLVFEIKPKRSGWVVARALFRAPDGLLRQAHTSPIYLSVDGKPTASAEDARYMLQWLDVLESIARDNPDRFPTSRIRNEVLSDYQEARDRYLQILEQSRETWGDR